MMDIRFSKRAKKAIELLDKKHRGDLLKHLNGLTKDPTLGDIKNMQGRPEGRKD